jgi:outer membrane protein
MIDGYGRTALAAAAWFISASCYPAPSQAQTPEPQAASDGPVDFDIPAQPLAAALNAWAVQANAQVFVDPGPVAHLTAPAIKGTLAPRQALRALLSHSNLQVVQGTNGVFVIKPRAVLAAAPRPATPAPVTEATPVAPAPAAPLTARASEGPWLLRLDADFVSGNGAVSGGGTAAVGAEYFITDHVAGAVSVTLPRTYSFGMPGSGRLQSSTAILKYYFAPENRLRPYVGAGIDVTALYGATAVGVDHASVGPAVQAGLDLRLSPHWMLNADVSWAQVRPRLAAYPGQDIHIDPLQFGLGVVYRF